MAINVDLKLNDQATRVYNQFVGNVTRQAASIDTVMKGIGTTIGAAFTVGAVVNFMKAGADAEAQTLKLEQALAAQGLASEENKKALLDNSQILKNKLAIDDDEINRLQAMIVGMTGNVQATRQLTPLIFDMSHALGVGADQVARMLARTNEGEETLKRYGITIGKTSSEQERLGKIIEEVTKKYGGQRAAFAQSDAGKIELATVQMEDFGEEIGKVLNDALIPFIPTFKALEPAAKLVGGALYMVYGIVTQFSAGLVGAVAVVERLNNALGITSSTFFTELAGQLERQSQQWAAMAFGIDTAGTAATAAGANINKAGNEGAASTKLLSDQIKELKKELDALNPGTNAYIDKLIQINAAQESYNQKVAESAIRAQFAAEVEVSESDKKFSAMIMGQRQFEIESTSSLRKNLEIQNKWSNIFAAIDLKNKKINLKKEQELLEQDLDYKLELYGNFTGAVDSTLRSVLVTGFNNILGEQNSVLEIFLGAVAQNLIAWGAKQIAQALLNAANAAATSAAALAAVSAEMAALQLAAAPAALAVNIASFGGAGMAAASSAGVAAGAQIAAMAAVANVKFHEGGTMGQFGERIPLRNDERPAILKVGETVRTPEQEQRLQQSGSTTFVFNNYAPITNEQAAMELLGKIGRMLGVQNVGQIIVNQRSALAIS